MKLLLSDNVVKGPPNYRHRRIFDKNHQTATIDVSSLLIVAFIKLITTTTTTTTTTSAAAAAAVASKY